MLRGPQTPGELKQRTERLHPFESLEDVEAVLGGLIERDFVVHLERRPGQKEARYAQILGGETEEATVVATVDVESDAPAARIDALEERVSRLEDAVTALQSRQVEPGGSDFRISGG